MDTDDGFTKTSEYAYAFEKLLKLVRSHTGEGKVMEGW